MTFAENLEARTGVALGAYSDLSDLGPPMTFAELPAGVVKSGQFTPSCKLSLGKAAAQKLKAGAVQLEIISMRPTADIEDVTLCIMDFTGSVKIMIGSAGTVVLGRLGMVRLDVRLGHSGVLVIGDDTTINQARLIAVNATILVGQDGLWSDEILVQGFDQHGIIDLATRTFINLDRNRVVIDRHCWIGRRVTLMPGTTVEAGSIIGACAVVTSHIAGCAVAVGNPARVVRDGVSWSRIWTGMDPGTQSFLRDYKL